MSETVRFQEVLRRLAMVDETFVTGQAGLGLGPAGTVALDGRTAALLQLAVSVALGSSGACLEWSTARALAAGATDDEIADVLLVIAPVAGLGPRRLCRSRRGHRSGLRRCGRARRSRRQLISFLCIYRMFTGGGPESGLSC